MSLGPESADLTRECVRAVHEDMVGRFWQLYGGTIFTSARTRGDKRVEVRVGCPQVQQAWELHLDTPQSGRAAPHRPQWGLGWPLGQPFAFGSLVELQEQLHSSLVAAGAKPWVFSP